MSRDGWQVAKLGNITSKIGSGATPRGGKEAYKETGLTLIRSLNVYDFSFASDGLAYIDDQQAQQLANVAVAPKDILLNITGASVARCCMVPETVLPARVNQHVAIVRVNPVVADPTFVYYSINSPHYKRRLLSLAQGGATREALTKDTISEFEIALPPLPTQRKIAAVLSGYDDLIENNTRRIALLEALARAVYHEWFVALRFPGHATTPIADTSTGPLPEGWEVKPVSECVETLGGGTPATGNPLFWDKGDVVWFSPTDLTAAKALFVSDSAKHITPAGVQQSSARLFPPYSVMMTSRATIGVVAINTREACTNQGFIILLPSERLSHLYLSFWLQSQHEKINSLATGATFKEISRGIFRQMLLTVPSLEIAQKFHAITQPIGAAIENLLTKNATLRRTRDLLLPRLVAGTVDVADAAIATGAEEG